jgi:dinuclear metal center YbgI/SA1388 family protein
MKIKDIINILEAFAPVALQEDYDNSGLTVGDRENDCSGCLVCLDVTLEIIDEALKKNCNLVISHHPVIFKGLKQLAGKSMVERIVMKAVRHDIVLYSMHTNLDNVKGGVNRVLSEKLGLVNLSILRQSPGMLRKIVTFCPTDHSEQVRQAIFRAGAGQIGDYDQCSFNAEGLGSFRAGDSSNPFVGHIGEIHFEKETRIETIFPAFLQQRVISALVEAHPYEEVAYDIYPLENEFEQTGAGMIGSLPQPVSGREFLEVIKKALNVPVIRHSALLDRMVKRVAVCGGSGSFLIPDAIRQQADFFITADVKYHQFFDAEGRIVIVDAGHYETEQFTCNLIADYLKENFPTFAVQISETPANPVNYF